VWTAVCVCGPVAPWDLERPTSLVPWCWSRRWPDAIRLWRSPPQEDGRTCVSGVCRPIASERVASIWGRCRGSAKLRSRRSGAACVAGAWRRTRAVAPVGGSIASGRARSSPRQRRSHQRSLPSKSARHPPCWPLTSQKPASAGSVWVGRCCGESGRRKLASSGAVAAATGPRQEDRRCCCSCGRGPLVALASCLAATTGFLDRFSAVEPPGRWICSRNIAELGPGWRRPGRIRA